MKKLFGVFVMVLCMAGVNAKADTALNMDSANMKSMVENMKALVDSGATLQARYRSCDDHPGRPTPNSVGEEGTTVKPFGHCEPRRKQCPPGYSLEPSYCWGSGHHGHGLWHRCGWVCRDNGMYAGAGDGGAGNGGSANGGDGPSAGCANAASAE